ncbi:translational machinery component [Ascobolus immersus RN42]|uniref:Translational machinery component n=1 Tax=Ascobolus immersus RN42 TaxID=1160509 RepID=A0A3N4IE97_ASCIM|nr:translational machinery component [Ascobolus immersus RN42]
MTTLSACRSAFAGLARPSTRAIAVPTTAARFNSTSSSSPSKDQLEELIEQSKSRQPAPVYSLSNTIGMISKRPSSRTGGYGLSDSEGGEWKPHGQGDHHLHVYSHKHNTHITFTRPDKGPIISLSCGNIGFKKAQRGTYDAGYQLAAKVFKMIEEKRIMPKQVELIYRGFGIGREAVTKALLSSEGRSLRPVINRVTDSTRLKFGGTRSPKPRRLG